MSEGDTRDPEVRAFELALHMDGSDADIASAIRVLKRAVAPLYAAHRAKTLEIAETHRPAILPHVIDLAVEGNGVAVETRWEQGLVLANNVAARTERRALFGELDEIGRAIAPYRKALKRLKAEHDKRETEAEKAGQELERAKRRKKASRNEEKQIGLGF